VAPKARIDARPEVPVASVVRYPLRGCSAPVDPHSGEVLDEVHVNKTLWRIAFANLENIENLN
jgi:hypothetical protein